MYRVIVVDDEENIRNGLSAFINNTFDSFTVVAEFEDGSDAIEYLKNNNVDIVITDICMSTTSGIDIAEYIYNNCSWIYIVFISGYHEFEYARQALKYNVKYYLSKPVSIPEITKTLNDIKQSMDATGYEKRNLSSIAKTDFFASLLSGKQRTKEDIEKTIKDLNLSAKYLLCKFSIFTIFIEDSNFWHRPEHDFSMALFNILREIKQIDEFVLVNKEHYNLTFIVISAQFDSIEILHNYLEINLKKLMNEINLLLGITLHFNIHATVPDLYSLAEYSSTEQDLTENNYIVNNAVEYIANNYMNNISLADIANHVHVNSSYLSHHFKQRMGINLSRYLLEYRMKTAIALINENKYKITDISEKCGYRSSKYFAKSFKEYTGLSPTEYIRTRKKQMRGLYD